MKTQTDAFSAVHPSVRDVFVGDTIDPLSVTVQQGLQGVNPVTANANVTFAPFGAGLDFGAVSSATLTPATLTNPVDSKGRTTATQFVAAGVAASSAISPDYGIARVLAYAPPTTIATLTPADLPWAASFTVRVWKRASAQLEPCGGNQQSTEANRYFGESLCVMVTDSVGSARATDGMAVQFEIADGDARFDTESDSDRYQTITPTTAWVLSQGGPAMAPPIRAGFTKGTVTVVATSRFSDVRVVFYINVV
ncbi:hypothetical protein [Bordetella sp. LUAb4]|uniref:hypothetical protein n=1 Tax=Bordetella sp. LUAb4 TaxID=2843195 RepID=UPI001E579C16|nr:hypothetical protein [Bordetella sp. LUAb4]